MWPFSKRRLVIMGAGGFARELFAWCEQAGKPATHFFSEDQTGRHFGASIVASLAGLKGASFLLGVGDPITKMRFFSMAIDAGLTPADLICKGVTLGRNIQTGNGVILCPGVVLSSDITLHAGVMVNLNCTIGHDCQIGQFATISPGANISGNCRVGLRAYIGTNASLRQGVGVAEDAVLGAGAVLLGSIPRGEIWGGVPAKKLPTH